VSRRYKGRAMMWQHTLQGTTRSVGGVSHGRPGAHLHTGAGPGQRRQGAAWLAQSSPLRRGRSGVRGCGVTCRLKTSISRRGRFGCSYW
jgi:hypothetical protein